MTTPVNPMDSGGSRPVPDPTLLTTEALLREILHLRELMEGRITRVEILCAEKFNAVEGRLHVSEDARREQKVDTNEAIGAALDAQEKAAQKSENAISKQLEQMGSTFKAGIDNLSESVNDVKDRVTRMEAVKLGSTESRSGLYAAIGIAVTLVLAVLAVIAFTQGA